MTLPLANSPVWPRLANGGLAKLRTQNLGIQLMAKRLERTPAPAETKGAEVHAFFVKWERTLAAEIQQLASL